MSAADRSELIAIRRMPYGTARIAASEAVTRRIDSDGPRELLAEALLDLVEAYSFADEGAKSFVVFARALRLWDESPELFDAGDERNLFWEFKWVAGDLPEFPQISAAQAEAFLTDMERRFELAGHGLSSVRMSRFRWAWHAGQADAEARRLAWVTGLRDEYEDCRACTIGQQVDFFVDTERYDEAVALGRTQDDRCNLEPARTHYGLGLAALMAGDPELALRSHKRALAGDDGGTTDFPAARGQGFEMLARGGRLDQALRVLRSDYPGALRASGSPAMQLRFLLGVLAGLSANLDRAAEPTGFAEPEWHTVGELHRWVQDRARVLAAPLDARNGTDMYARKLARAAAASRTSVALPGEAETAGEAPSGTPATPTPPVESAEGREAAEGSASAAGASSGDALWAAAEQLAAYRAYDGASRAYVTAAERLEAEGWIARAGAAYAEAAQCAVLDQEDASAHGHFAAAVARLQLDHAESELLVAVLTAWAPIAVRMADAAGLIAAIRQALAEDPEPDTGGLRADLAERRLAEWRLRQAHLRDTLARALAAEASVDAEASAARQREAVAEALSAGAAYAQLGRVSDAAHAFWLAGRVHRGLGAAADAVWALESAFEGFTLARNRADRALAAGELIDVLRATGQNDRAAEIVAEL